LLNIHTGTWKNIDPWPFSILIILVEPIHRNQNINRKGAYIISRRPSHGQCERRCCHQAFLRIFSEVTYTGIRTVGNSTMFKIYTLPNHTITIGVCILETQLSSLLPYMVVALVSDGNGPCCGCLPIRYLYRSLFYIIWFLWPEFEAATQICLTNWCNWSRDSIKTAKIRYRYCIISKVPGRFSILAWFNGELLGIFLSDSLQQFLPVHFLFKFISSFKLL
jgi:hypothetical protein